MAGFVVEPLERGYGTTRKFALVVYFSPHFRYSSDFINIEGVLQVFVLGSRKMLCRLFWYIKGLL